MGTRRLRGVLGPSALVWGAGGLRVMAECHCCALLSTDHISEVTVFGGGVESEGSLFPIVLATALPR